MSYLHTKNRQSKNVLTLLAASLSGLFLLLNISTLQASESQLGHLATYQQQGVTSIDEKSGEQLWNSVVNQRSCAQCHGDDLTKTGKHVKTGKVIQPMALSVNSQRYQDGRKIEKWFLRNCKWTFARQCSTQEKANILSWLANQ